RLVPYKGTDILVEAAADLVRAGRVAIEIFGDGPERPRLERMVAGFGLTSGIEFAGFVDHRELQNPLCRAQVLGFPSVREFGGTVVLEAMALGLVPIVVDYGGPGELTTHDTGIKVPLGSRADIVRGLRAALERIAADPYRLRDLSIRARA